jgi:hypothetical protein
LQESLLIEHGECIHEKEHGCKERDVHKVSPQVWKKRKKRWRRRARSLPSSKQPSVNPMLAKDLVI